METTREEILSSIKGKTTSAKKIPFWLWIIIAKALGIKLHPNEKPIISAILHILTFGSAAALFVTNGLISGYNVMSKHTKEDILDGTVSVMVMSFFCGLGVYSHRLAYRLFVHPKFLDMLRLHSKTIMKLNSALVIFLILSSFVAVFNVATINNTYSFVENVTIVNPNDNPAPKPSYNESDLNPCQLVEMDASICQIYWASQLLFSLHFLVWNLLVAVVLVSVARTQTISIRKFLRELEQDAILLDRQLHASYGKQVSNSQDNLKNYVWTDDDHIADVFDETKTQPTGENGNQQPRRASSGSSSNFNDLQLRLGEQQVDDRVEVLPDRDASTFQRLESAIEEAEQAVQPHIMNEQEIMHKYWKISMNVRLASVALQRWMSSIIAVIVTFSAIRMVYWLSHSPTWYGVYMFITPLLLLPLLASSYAEVNYEGVKVIQSILPTEKRVHMFQYLYGHPIQMTVYGHAISYGTIGTVVAGILAAFASKILLQEIGAA